MNGIVEKRLKQRHGGPRDKSDSARSSRRVLCGNALLCDMPSGHRMTDTGSERLHTCGWWTEGEVLLAESASMWLSMFSMLSMVVGTCPPCWASGIGLPSCTELRGRAEPVQPAIHFRARILRLHHNRQLEVSLVKGGSQQVVAQSIVYVVVGSSGGPSYPVV